MPNRVYIARNQAAHSTAITILQVTAGATRGLEVIRAWVTQTSSTTSAQTGVRLLRKTGTATGTGLTPVKADPADQAFSGTALHTASAEGTDGDILVGEGFNVLNGWLYLPVPEERIFVPAAGIIALKFPGAPPNVTYAYGMIVREF